MNDDRAHRTDPAGAARYLAGRIPRRPRVALILGSGLGGLADAIEDPVAVPYMDVPGFAVPTVAGHAGRVVAGRLEGVDVLAFQGRYHAYEGHEPQQLALPVRTAAALGAEALIVTCAAGGVNRAFAPGTLMLITDHLNLTGRNPLVGPVEAGEERFPDMSAAYDPALRETAAAVAADAGLELSRGIYAAVLGPSYETPAEIRMIERLGADAVGMSTVAEVIAARAAGLRVLGIALITNPAAGILAEPLAHADVVAVAGDAAGRMTALVRGVVARL